MPPRSRRQNPLPQQPEPSALDRLDPAPQEQRGPAPPTPVPRQPRQRKPPQVTPGVRRELARFPDDLRKGGIAATALRLAAELDAGLVIGRDAAGHAREIRMCITQLREFAPGEVKGDSTDEVRERRERRLGRAQQENPA